MKSYHLTDTKKGNRCLLSCPSILPSMPVSNHCILRLYSGYPQNCHFRLFSGCLRFSFEVVFSALFVINPWILLLGNRIRTTLFVIPLRISLQGYQNYTKHGNRFNVCGCGVISFHIPLIRKKILTTILYSSYSLLTLFSDNISITNGARVSLYQQIGRVPYVVRRGE
jgi:hypothetical protein